MILWLIVAAGLIIFTAVVYRNLNEQQQDSFLTCLKILLIIPAIVLSYYLARIVEPLVVGLLAGVMIGSWSIATHGSLLLTVLILLLIVVILVILYKIIKK